MRLSDNTVLITGGATGIGLALAEAFLEHGNQVLICGRRSEKLKAARKKFPEVQVRVCDVTKPRSRSALLKWATGRFESLNILVNNAGIQNAVDFTRGPRDLALADAEIATNLTAVVHLSALFIPHLLRKKQAAIVNISSGLAFAPIAALPVYCATKAAVHSLTMSMRHQLRDTPTKVFEVAPPMVATALGGRRRSAEEIERCMPVEDVAKGALDAIQHDIYEVALGGAAGLRRRGESLFEDMNG
jgi:uncharacterized oxidoreductase